MVGVYSIAGYLIPTWISPLSSEKSRILHRMFVVRLRFDLVGWCVIVYVRDKEFATLM
jgi:hypothetical protein